MEELAGGGEGIVPQRPQVLVSAARDGGTVRNKAVHVAFGVRPDGTKEILGLWDEQAEAPSSGCAS